MRKGFIAALLLAGFVFGYGHYTRSYAPVEQVTTLRKGSGGWKVVAFDNKFEKMDSLSK